MNGFVTAAGCYVCEVIDEALETADAIGPVSVEMGDMACKVPSAIEAIEKVKGRGTIGKKRKAGRL